jgi:hypothetical protein
MFGRYSLPRLWNTILLARKRKSLLLCLILLSAGLGYVALALGISADTAIIEQHFGEGRQNDARQLRVYVEILAVDAVNESMRLRVSFAPSPALQGRRPDVADQELRVQLGDGDHVQELMFHAQEAMAAASFEIDLHDGTVAAYPLDRFRARLRVTARDAAGASAALQVTVWEGIIGWTLDVAQTPGAAAAEVQLQLGVRRSAALRLLVLAIYGEMALVGLAALTIGGLAFLGARPPESTLTGALTGMVFALPVLRYALPGSPPLGVRADLLVYFWAELAVTLALALFIVTWAQTRLRG